jgi:hypothetical protein
VLSAAGTSFEFCCIDVPSGACAPDAYVPNCTGTNLFGFACTGTTTPQTQIAGLHCFVGAPDRNNAGKTQYCCAG